VLLQQLLARGGRARRLANDEMAGQPEGQQVGEDGRLLAFRAAREDRPNAVHGLFDLGGAALVRHIVLAILEAGRRDEPQSHESQVTNPLRISAIKS
jgi:hypothetical protein